MNQPLVKTLKFDQYGNNKDNVQTGELVEVGDKKWGFVPLQAPFFMDSVRLYLDNGIELVLGTDYEFYNLMGKLSAYCAREVGSIILITNKNLTSLRIDYHSLGAVSVFDQSLVNLINNAINDDRPVYWSDVTNKPEWFAGEWHGHDQAVDGVGYAEISATLDLMTENLYTTSSSLAYVSGASQADKLTHYIELYKTQMVNYFSRHADQTNAHGLTKEQVGLGNVPNYGVSDPTQTGYGTRTDLFVTPAGLGTALKKYEDVADDIINGGVSEDSYVRAGVLPIYRYGDGSYIPPSIDGSFVGLGARKVTTSFCLEENDDLIGLTARYDGISEGLYYMRCRNYSTTSTLTWEFTGHAYKHAYFENQKLTPNYVFTSDGGEVLVVAIGTSTTSRRWFITLTNGSLNPANHKWSEISNPNLFTALQPYNTSVKVVGDNVLFIGNNLNSASNANFYLMFCYCAKAKIGIDSKVELVTRTISYPQTDNTYILESDYLYPFNMTRNESGWLLTSEVDYSAYPCSYNARRGNMPIMIDDNGDGSATIKLVVCNILQNTDKINGVVYGSVRYTEVIYHADFVNGGFSLSPDVQQPGPYTLNETQAKDRDPYGYVAYEQLSKIFNTVDDRQGGISCVCLTNGDIVMVSCLTGYGTVPTQLSVARGIGSDRKTTVNNYLNNASKTVYTVKKVKEQETSVTGVYKYNMPVCISDIGEFMGSWLINTDKHIGLFREVTGDFQKIPDVTNLEITNDFYSRPLTNSYYKYANSNLPSGKFTLPLINISGSEAVLKKAGLKLGEALISVGGIVYDNTTLTESVYLSANNFNNDYNGGLALPTSFEIVKDESAKTFSIDVSNTSRIIYSRAIIESFITNITTLAETAKAKVLVTIADTSNSKISPDTSFAMVTIADKDVLNKINNTIFIFKATYKTVGNNKEVTGIEISNMTTYASTGTRISTNARGVNSFVTNINPNIAPFNFIYVKDDDNLDMAVCAAGGTSYTGGDSGINYRFRYAKATKKVSYASFYGSYSYGITHNQVGMVPKVGLVVANSSNYTGTAGTVGQLFTDTNAVSWSSANKTWLLASNYPESGWSVFFKQEEPIVLNGGNYTLPVGYIDLRDITSEYRNQTFYIYARLGSDGKATYTVSLTLKSETSSNALVSIVKTNDKKIVSITSNNVFSIFGYRVSETKIGYGIPATSESNTLPWLTKAELL